MHAARKIGVVYRDAKLSDILVDEDDFAYLIDFGIALDAASTGVTKLRVRSLYEKDFRRYIRRRVDPRIVRSDLGAPGIRSAWW